MKMRSIMFHAFTINASQKTLGRSLKISTMYLSLNQQMSSIIREIPSREEDKVASEVGMITAEVVDLEMDLKNRSCSSEIITS